MDKNILKLIGVGVVAYYFLKSKKTDTTTGVTTTPVTTTPVTTIPDTPIDVIPDPIDVIPDPIDVTPEGIQGCQDSSATNFNSLATSPCDTVTPTGTSGSSTMTRGFDGESYEDGGLFINSDY